MLPIKLSSTGQLFFSCADVLRFLAGMHVHNPIALVPRLSDIPTHSQCHHVLVYSVMIIVGGGGGVNLMISN